MLIIILWLKKLRAILKFPSLKLTKESELLNLRIFLVKITLRIGQEKLLLLSIKIIIIDSVLKTNPWTYKIKDLTLEKNDGIFLWKRIAVE